MGGKKKFEDFSAALVAQRKKRVLLREVRARAILPQWSWQMGPTFSRVAEYVQDRRFAGQLADATSVGHADQDGHPPEVTIFLRISDSAVQDGRYQASGCGYLFACCAAAIELSMGRTIEESAALGAQQVADHLGDLPPHRWYCAELAITALHNAISGYRGSVHGEGGAP